MCKIDEKISIFSEEEWRLILPNSETIETDEKLNYFNNDGWEKMIESIEFMRASQMMATCMGRYFQTELEHFNTILRSANAIEFDLEKESISY